MRKTNKIIRTKFAVMGGYEVHIELSSDPEKALSKYPETKNAEWGAETDGIAIHCKDEGRSFVFLKHNASAGNVAHESWHVVRRMMNWLGVDLDNEAVAYHLGYLVNRIVEAQRR